MRPTPLLALLLACPGLGAEGDFGAAGLDLGAAKSISGRAPANAGTDRSARVRAAHDAIKNAGLPLWKFIEVGENKMNWSVDNMADFAGVLEAASRAVCQLHARYPSAVADAYGNGTMTNMEDTFKMFGGGNLERGCISHQSTVFSAAKPVAGPSLSVRKIRYGLPPLQHNAVVVFPAGSDWMYTSVVLDPWLRQKCSTDKMTYFYENWGPIRPIWGVHVEPRYWKANVRLLADDE